MLSNGLILTVNYNNLGKLKQLFPNLQLISIESVDNIQFFNKYDIVCVIVDIENTVYYSTNSLIEELSNFSVEFILTTTNYKQVAEFANSGIPVYNRMSLVEEKILELYGKRINRTYSGYVFNYEKRTVFINNNEYKIRNTPFLIFSYLVKNKNKICSREDIIKGIAISTNPSEQKLVKQLSDSRTIDVHIHYLRKTIADDRLKTVIHEGYIFEDK